MREASPITSLRHRSKPILPALGIGITNLVDRVTVAASELDRAELRAGGLRLEAKAKDLRPHFVAVLGLGAYRTAFGRPAAEIGEQEERLAASRLWLLPNPSGLQAAVPNARDDGALPEPSCRRGRLRARTRRLDAVRVPGGRLWQSRSSAEPITAPICSVSSRKPSWPKADWTTATGRSPGSSRPSSSWSSSGYRRSDAIPATVMSACTWPRACCQPTAPPAHVVVVHGLAQHDVGVGVEPFDQLVPVVLQVRLHGEPPAFERVLLGLRASPESTLELAGGPVGHLTDAPGEGQPVNRVRTLRVVVASGECRVIADGSDLQRAQRDLLRRRGSPDRQHDGAPNPLGVSDAPFEHPHSAHRSPDDAGPFPDAECVGERRLDRDLVPDGDDRETRAVGHPVRGPARQGRSSPDTRRARWGRRRNSDPYRAPVPARSGRPTSRRRRDPDRPDPPHGNPSSGHAEPARHCSVRR